MAADAQVEDVWRALGVLGAGLTQAFDSPVAGDPEDQLKSHVRPFIEQCGKALGFPVVAKTESRYADVGGRPDLGIDVRGALCGHIELKAPGHGVNPNRFTGRNRQQWNNFKNLPNLIYTDGSEWILFHTGQRVARVRLSGDPTSDGFEAATTTDAEWLAVLLHTFFLWQPIAPATANSWPSSLRRWPGCCVASYWRRWTTKTRRCRNCAGTGSRRCLPTPISHSSPTPTRRR